MVKNTFGGSKAKSQARKFTNTHKDNKFLRVSENEFELYAQVIKLLGNGMCHVLCDDMKTRLCHIRRKFRGRNQKDNNVTNTSWVLVGIRDWESSKKADSKLDNCDLLEVYDDYDRERLKTTVHNINWDIFNNDNNASNNNLNNEFEFADETMNEYIELMEKHIQSNLNNNSLNDKESIDIMINPDDI